ncbi:MAG TPA: hypothetical protein VGK93_11480 [Candidatus Eisenbacteria bacterium]
MQLTRGNGPDIGMRVSTDGKTLLYLQQQTVGNVWIAALDGGEAQQVTHDDQPVRAAALSPDNQRIAAIIFSSDPLAPGTQAIVMSRDGTARRPITPENQAPQALSWSSDGRWLAYTAAPRDQPTDSSSLFLMDGVSLSEPRLLARGQAFLGGWLDSTRLTSFDASSGDPRIVRVDGRVEPVPDSTISYPAPDGRYAVIARLKRNARLRIPAWGPNPLASFHDIPGLESGWGIDRRGRFLIAFPAPEQVERIWLPGLRRERLPTRFLHLGPFSPSKLSPDGTQLIYIDQHSSSKS